MAEGWTRLQLPEGVGKIQMTKRTQKGSPGEGEWQQENGTRVYTDTELRARFGGKGLEPRGGFISSKEGNLGNYKIRVSGAWAVARNCR